jgi:chromosome segregation protein
MQDVIFNGSTHRKPAGRASVELVFDNSLGKAAGQWGQYAEIAVKRTLTRDGTSSYFINGQAVRRRDIQDIFLGTGLGPRAYAIIGQGMISRIIEARPEELRIFLEEAAGVSRYKERRRETENRIHDTTENLVRVEDILRELNNNLEKLEAQAVVATKYHELMADQEEKQKLLWLLRRNEAAEQKNISLKSRKPSWNWRRKLHSCAILSWNWSKCARPIMRSAIMHQAQGHLYQTNAEIGSLEAQIRFVIESRTRLQNQIQTLKAQREQWLSQQRDLQDALRDAEAEVEELAMRTEQAAEMTQQHQDEIPDLEKAWRDAQSQSTESRARIMQLQQQIELESAQQRNANQILNSLAARKERLQQEKHGLSKPDSAHLDNLNFQLEEKKQILEELQFQSEDAAAKLPEMEMQRRQAQEQVSKDTAELAQLEARLQTLKQLQEKVASQVR